MLAESTLGGFCCYEFVIQEILKRRAFAIIALIFLSELCFR
ncbi:hypothetical protein Cs308_0741 [Candidatus Chlamydia sanziniae]|uniref:Uncharacterized protein n=1 Tax=Candidatus Chlamydia sanziniae TaxID=1806891 RepID=A0A1A9HWU7_9CHLA|nr:hypothetical protein Cs308_0741 [Candidatus Chlamydia sanziniae]